MKLYSSVAGPGEGEQVIDRSRFIVHVIPAETREEAEAFFDRIRHEYHDARHNVPAMVIGDKMQIQWASDDGEPQGTSGAPIVQLLVQEGITNVAIMVTRYFGGIKLGTGGLVRAYTSSAQIGLQNAGICDVRQMSILPCKIDYKGFHRVQNYDFGTGVTLENIEYAGDVSFQIICEPEKELEIQNLLLTMTAGNVIMDSVSYRAVKVRR